MGLELLFESWPLKEQGTYGQFFAELRWLTSHARTAPSHKNKNTIFLM